MSTRIDSGNSPTLIIPSDNEGAVVVNAEDPIIAKIRTSCLSPRLVNTLTHTAKRLSDSDLITRVEFNHWQDKVTHVERGSYGICCNASLGTCEVQSDFVACFRGKTAKNESILAILHTSPTFSFLDAASHIMQQMERKGTRNIEVMVIGGMAPNPVTGYEGTVREELEILRWAEAFKIVAVEFNRNTDCVVLTPTDVLVSRYELYDPSPVMEYTEEVSEPEDEYGVWDSDNTEGSETEVTSASDDEFEDYTCEPKREFKHEKRQKRQ